MGGLGSELRRQAEGYHHQALDLRPQKSSCCCVFSTLIQTDAGSKKIGRNL
jgi:hypothetical protein